MVFWILKKNYILVAQILQVIFRSKNSSKVKKTNKQKIGLEKSYIKIQDAKLKLLGYQFLILLIQWYLNVNNKYSAALKIHIIMAFLCFRTNNTKTN